MIHDSQEDVTNERINRTTRKWEPLWAGFIGIKVGKKGIDESACHQMDGASSERKKRTRHSTLPRMNFFFFFRMPETNMMAVRAHHRGVQSHRGEQTGSSSVFPRWCARSIGLTPYESNFIPRVIKLD